MAGITNKVKTKENNVPPTITTPIPILLVEAAPRDKAIGKAMRQMNADHKGDKQFSVGVVFAPAL